MGSMAKHLRVHSGKSFEALLKASDETLPVVVVGVVVVDPTPPTCCQQSPAPEIMWQPAVSPPQVARKGSTLSGFVQRSRLEREVGSDLHSNKWEEV